jgi:hypothetical protein
MYDYRESMWKQIGRQFIYPILVPLVLVTYSTARADDSASDSYQLRDAVIGQRLDLSASGNYQAQSGQAENALSQGVSNEFALRSAVSSGDTTAPSAGSVFAGSLNQQASPNSISANWTGFADAQSGVVGYEFRLRRASDNKCWGNVLHLWLPCDIWNPVDSTNYTVAHANLKLRAATQYITCVRAINGAQLHSATVCAPAAQVPEVTSFSYDATGVTLPLLSPANASDITGGTRLSVSTNAYNGYTIYGAKSGPLTSLTNPSHTIPDISDGGCSGSAMSWPGVTAFGISSSDSVDGDKFHAGGTKYCSLPNTTNPLLGLPVAHVTSPTEGSLLDQAHDITYRVQVDFDQPSGDYTTTVLYTILPNY